MKQFVYIFFFIACYLLFPGIGINCFGQDPQYSQFYAAPLYLNPALTGTIRYGRMAANARNQWKKNVNRFDSRAFSADFNIRKYKIGVGALITRDYAGYDAIYDLPGIGPRNKVLRQTNIGLLGSYFIPVNKHWHTRVG
ncbi:MAG: type IX secretion system membrane protein PorP/SprF, partial [Solirubrobacterales bacterium]|nr:type IX secretion system membrane protein PorP/SprF [Solirubrobacterales bacterium]